MKYIADNLVYWLIYLQLEKLDSLGFGIILVTSGAVGAGRQRLKYRKLINNSFAGLQKPQVELDGKAYASVGQNDLMALYDTLLSQLDVTSSQLVVTDNDSRTQTSECSFLKKWILC